MNLASMMNAFDEPHDTTLRVDPASGRQRDTPSSLLRVSRLELRRLARRLIASLPPGTPLQPTAVVNEVARRLLGGSGAQDLPSRGDFYAELALEFRRLLRNGESLPSETPLAVAVSDREAPPVVLRLDAALTALEARSPQHAQVATLHLLGGMTLEEIAEQMFASEDRVARAWRDARLWLESWFTASGRSR